MARQVLRHPTTSVLHDVRVWVVRGSASDLFNIRPKLEGLIEGDVHGLHRESDVLVGPYAVLYADAVREAIRALPPPPPQTDSVPTGLPVVLPTRRRLAGGGESIRHRTSRTRNGRRVLFARVESCGFFTSGLEAATTLRLTSRYSKVAW